MKMKRLTAQQAIRLIGEFCDTVGAMAVLLSFGWQRPPQNLRANEHVYAATDMIDKKKTLAEGERKGRDAPTLVGFGIIELNTHDAEDDEAFLSCGVFPAYRHRGYWHAITAWMVERARELGADYATRFVFKENEEHYTRSMREAHEPGSPWVYAGDIWFPGPGYGKFMVPLEAEPAEEAPEDPEARLSHPEAGSEGA